MNVNHSTTIDLESTFTLDDLLVATKDIPREATVSIRHSPYMDQFDRGSTSMVFSWTTDESRD